MNIDPDAPLKEMTIRAEIASRLLSGLYAAPESPDQDQSVRWAIAGADALIAELNKNVEHMERAVK